MNLKQEMGEKIKRLRKSRGVTQEQLAEMVDISSRNISNIELGISFPKPETLEKIMTALDITTEKLFANDHIKPNSELVSNIKNYINLVKDDNRKLEQIYKLIRSLVEEN